MKKKMIVLLIGLSTALLFGCGKKNTENADKTSTSAEDSVTTENQEVSEQKKEEDVTRAQDIKAALEAALGNENIFPELTTKYVNRLIALTDQGLSVLEATTRDVILENMGGIPEIKYRTNGADHFAFIVDEKGNVTVYACNTNNSTKWMLTPQLDVEYGGTVNSQLLDSDPTVIATAETDVELEQVMISDDVTSAKSIRIAVETALGKEEMFEELTTEHAGEYITASEQGMSVLSEETREEILSNLGTLPIVNYTKNGADHFEFVVDETGNVTVYVCTVDGSLKWILTPELDVEYGGTVAVENAPENTSEEEVE